jgi:hypothetical protein
MRGAYREATLTGLVRKERFGEAAALLKEQIQTAELVDPRRDDSWGIDADILGYAILQREGTGAFRAYWEGLLRFFTEELEPAWGHLHKGHIYLRLGIASLGGAMEEAAAYLEQGLAEDRLVAQERKKRDPELDVEEAVRDSPAYITLCTALLLQRLPFPSAQARAGLFGELVSVKFDVIWGPQEVEPGRTRRALRRILGPAPGLSPDTVLAAKEELDRLFDARLPLATLAMLRTFLALLLYALPVGQLPSEPQDGLPSAERLLALAEKARLFPHPGVATPLRLVAHLARLLPVSERLKLEVELTPRVRSQIVVMLKILVDLALVRWSEAL